MKSIFKCLILAICGFISANNSSRSGYHRHSIFKKHVELEDRISITQAPYIAAIIFGDYSRPRDRYSTAAIITNRFLISVPSYLTLPYVTDGYEVYVGHENLYNRSNVRVYRIEKFILRSPEYLNNRKQYYDIMLIKVDRDIDFNENVKPITLLSQNYYKRYQNNLDDFILVGYGGADVKDEPYSGMGYLHSKNLSISGLDLSAPSFILNSGYYNCPGDIGTPAILNENLAGLFSRGTKTRVNGIFIGIINQTDWITGQVGENNLLEAEKHAYKHQIN